MTAQTIAPTSKPEIQTLILDTNVILYCLSDNKDLSEKTRALLLAVSQSNYYLAINEITLFECFKKLKPDRIANFNSFLAIFKHYYIDKTALSLAADLFSFYDSNELVKPIINKISSEDIIIAATGMLTGGYILTTNFYDFPHPFFNCIYRNNLVYRDKSVDKMIPFYLLSADFPTFNDARAEWFKTKAPNANQGQLGV